jgi:hypothetical protein
MREVWYTELLGTAKRIHYTDGTTSGWMPAFS